jgi:uncharacterized protein YyaL (SSP411 family)
MDNPTAWQLWSPETLALSKKTNRPLFVSIGYSACHWCHVMAHESFANPRIAQLLNENFIPVKIDREERPDIDRQYMDFLQATTGAGGWPLNVFVTPDLEPVFGGTYWPGPKTEHALAGRGGFEEILKKVAQAWKEQEKNIRESGSKIADQLREFAQEGSLGGTQANGDVGDGEQDGMELDLLEESYQHYKQRFDTQYGGFGGAPKFPTPVHLGQLLRLNSYGSEVRGVVGEEECKDAQQMALKTLESMYKGAIKDQIGHGFARYSVTRDWSLPHFEKMLYDNAQLLPLYLDAWLLTNDPLFLEATNDIATYLTSKPMLSPLGAFHSSEDADSLPTADATEKREGAFYVYTYKELRDHDVFTTAEESDVVLYYWGLKPAGNIDSKFDAQGELRGQNTLRVQITPELLAKDLGYSEIKVKNAIRSSRQKLLAYRNANRPRPALDDKIVTSWNGLAISGLARTAASLAATHPEDSASYLSAAISAAECQPTSTTQPPKPSCESTAKAQATHPVSQTTTPSSSPASLTSTPQPSTRLGCAGLPSCKTPKSPSSGTRTNTLSSRRQPTNLTSSSAQKTAWTTPSPRPMASALTTYTGSAACSTTRNTPNSPSRPSLLSKSKSRLILVFSAACSFLSLLPSSARNAL